MQMTREVKMLMQTRVVIGLMQMTREVKGLMRMRMEMEINADVYIIFQPSTCVCNDSCYFKQQFRMQASLID